MQLGMTGMGRMGASLEGRLVKDGHRCVVYDVRSAAVKRTGDRGIRGAAAIDGLVLYAMAQHRRVAPYQRGRREPKEADGLIAADAVWCNPGDA